MQCALLHLFLKVMNIGRCVWCLFLCVVCHSVHLCCTVGCGVLYSVLFWLSYYLHCVLNDFFVVFVYIIHTLWLGVYACGWVHLCVTALTWLLGVIVLDWLLWQLLCGCVWMCCKQWAGLQSVVFWLSCYLYCATLFSCHACSFYQENPPVHTNSSF